MTIDSDTIEWIEENINPFSYNNYDDFLQDVLHHFDGRYVRSSGFRPALRDMYQNAQTELAIDLITRVYQNGDFQLAEFLLQKFNQDGQL